MKKEILFFILLLVSNYMYPNDIYKNAQIKISFKIPENCQVDTQDVKDKKFTIKVVTQLSSDLRDGKKEFNEIKMSIDKNMQPFYLYYPSSLVGFKKVNNIKAMIEFHMGNDAYEGIIGKMITFIKDEKIVYIFLNYNCDFSIDRESNDYIVKKILNIFFYYEDKLLKRRPQNDNEIMKVMDQIENDIKMIQAGGKAEVEYPTEMVELYKRFDELIASLSLYLYFTPSVSNLRLRELSDSNSNIIRQLIKGEKLELIEKGKTETIQNKEGNWIKVKTEKDEIGWCFDAYLKEWKEDGKK